ncbi:hypothetical protein BZG36_01466 [Bifiguratus adelaidae]|uniref:FMN hydroxy acid dehydrogenase domain-containing protein n=1 Tax=Bifiguratus adelaidae TaxID=1938954 RepID=A0A261Y4T3_9FUNG|nr:hypothetical protein BZG36_01466 [Bifiguratus adelaidae]
MSDPNNLPKRTTPHYALYQREIFIGGTEGRLPFFSTDPTALEEKAKEHLSLGGRLYAESNAGTSLTHRADREAFYRELPVAKVAAELNLPYCLSTAGSQPIEDVAKANGSGPRFYQLYMPHDDELTLSLLNRAWKSGFDVCIVTLDTWQLAWRHDDVRTANYAFYFGLGADIGLTDPVFRRRLKEAGVDPAKDPQKVGQLWIDNVWHGKAHTWQKMAWAMKEWKHISGGRPFLLKGIQCIEDALKAREYRVDGIVVSNHAGRQVDGAVGSLDVLEEIVQAVPELVVLYDSGIRGASDVFKAIALGAKAVLVGRLWVWGLSIQGEFGIRHVMKSLLAEFDILMNVAGYPSIKDVDRSALRVIPYGSSKF